MWLIRRNFNSFFEVASRSFPKEPKRNTFARNTQQIDRYVL